ncbi:MAG TPA: hypothetical protein VFP98_02395, partial [Candidatus Polarisedimenticolia bacterium]|nr:hypothetical protein [Candidatus Polarisedimenticolia bacterium]
TAYFAPRLRQSPESVTIHEFGHQYWYGMVATNEFEEAFLDEGFNTYSTGLVLEKAYGPNHESIELAPGLPYLAAPLLEIPLSSAPGGRGPRPAGVHARLLDLLLLRPFGPSDSLALNTFRDLPFLNHARHATIDQVTQQRRRYLAAPEADALARRSWEYLDNRVYGLNSYARTALVLRTLEGILGPDRMLRVMRDWFQRRQYRHPTLQDFIETVVQIAGPEADGRPIEEFLRQAFYGSDRMDYAAAELTVESDTQARGLIGPRGDRRLVTEDDIDTEESTETRRTRLLVRRFGGFAWPQTIELRLEDGRAERSVWDGGYRWMRLERDQPAAALVVDPDGAMALDANRSNNGRSVDRSALAWL